jgi:hypothetical protein
METSMTGTLRDTIHLLAADFAAGVLGVVRGASLEDILAETAQTGGVARRGRGRPPSVAAGVGSLANVAARAPRAPKSGRSGRLPRRSASDIGGVVAKIVDLLSGTPKGLRAEQIRAALNLSSKELPRPIAQALSSKQISKVGQKRATTYFARAAGSASAAGPAGGKGGREKAPSKRGRKAAKRSARSPKSPKRGRASSSAKPVSRPVEAVANGTSEAT